MFLLDTPIVLELRKAKSGGTDRGLIGWATKTPLSSLFISSLNLIEIEASILALDLRDKIGAQGLRHWLDVQVLRAFEGRILAIDTQVAQKRRFLTLSDSRNALMAAIALAHGLTLVTNSPNEFKGSKVKLFNPWGYEPSAEVETADWLQAAKSGPLWFKNLFIRS